VARIRAIDGVALTVSNAGRAAEFYTRVLFFEKMSDFELPRPDSRVRVVRMRLGDEMIELIEDPAAGRSLQRVAIVVIDHSAAVDAELREAALSPAAAGVRPVA
jgi:uncharacterized glyoxalase superfamily protein PhnB